MFSKVFEAANQLLARFAMRKLRRSPSLRPNVATIDAMKAARRGELVTVDRPEKLLPMLNEDDVER
jgi:DNA-damage-inducible protein J